MAVILVDEEGKKIRDLKWCGMPERNMIREAGYEIVDEDDRNVYVIPKNTYSSLSASDYMTMFNKKKTK